MILGFWGTFRDIIIILWGAFSVLALLAIILVALMIWSGVRRLIRTVNLTVNEDVKPILTITQDSATNVAGTATFLSDTVARPVIRGLSFVAGARRALAVFSGITGRGRKG